MITKKDFFEKYWYKQELVTLCKKLEISKNGTKAELQHRILNYIQTGKIDEIKIVKHAKRNNSPITLESCFIRDGLKFNKKLRDFMSNYFNIKKFTFTKYMGAAVRKAKNNGTDITVKELIDIYKQPKSSFKETPEDKTYQWNTFVKDFFQSSHSDKYTNKLVVASILWNIAKKNVDKVYSNDLLENNKILIKKYKIK